jgi:hypothetical protein
MCKCMTFHVFSNTMLSSVARSVRVCSETSAAELGYAYSAGRFRFRLRESVPVGAKNDLCLTVQVRIVVAGSGGSVQTVGVRRFTGMISSLFRLWESESEPESACNIGVP